MTAPPASADPAAEAQGPARFGDTRKLIDLSDVVVVGKVEKGKRTDNADNPDAITTVINVSVARAFKGTPGKTLAVRQRGGDLGDGTAIDSSLNAHLEAGERVVLFLRDNGDGTYRTVMGHLGAINEHVHAGRQTIANPLFDDDPSDVTVGSACTSAGPGFSGFSQIIDPSTGKHLVWSGQTMTWKISTNFTSQQSAADAAMATWNSAGGLFTMVNGGVTTAVATNADSESVISYENIASSTTLGYADFRRVIATGALTTADIHMNSNQPWAAGTANPTSTQYDTVSVLIHEMAHALGADHVNDNGQVTFPCLGAGVTKRTLGWGDRAMHKNFYPANDEGYWMVDARGNVYGLGGYGSFAHYNANYYGGAGPYISTSHSAVDIERKRPTYDGYWILGSNGGVYAFNSPFHGSAASHICGGCGTAVDMAVHPTGSWYGVLTTTGHTYAYPVGSPNYGGVTQWLTGGRYATGIATRPDGSAGWWIVNNLGEVYALGGAPYLLGGIPAGDQPAKGIIPSTSGNGYWIVGASGRVFSFGDAVGLAPSPQLSGTVKMDRTPTANTLVGIAGDGWTSFSGTTDYGRGTGQPAWGAIAAAKLPVAPTFTQTATPSAITVSRGQSSSFTVTDVSNETFFANVSYSLSGLPSGVGGSVSPNPVLLKSSSSASTTATISVPLAYTGPTTFNVTVTGCGQGICRNSTVSVAVLLV